MTTRGYRLDKKGREIFRGLGDRGRDPSFSETAAGGELFGQKVFCRRTERGKKRSLALPGGGLLWYEFTPGAVKNINLRVKDGAVFVSAPRRAAMRDVEAFLRSKEGFILAALERQRRRPPRLFAPPLAENGDTVFLFGEPFRLILRPGRPGFSFGEPVSFQREGARPEGSSDERGADEKAPNQNASKAPAYKDLAPKALQAENFREKMRRNGFREEKASIADAGSTASLGPEPEGCLFLSYRDETERKKAISLLIGDLSTEFDRMFAEVFASFAAFCQSPAAAPFLKGTAFVMAGGRPPAYSFRAMTSRWGSCSPARYRIVFAHMLFEKEPAAVKGVIAHELTHLLIADHSARFHACLDLFWPDNRHAARLL